MLTKEEAISLLKLAKAEIEWEYPLSYQLALDKAIKALKQQPKKGRWINIDETHSKCDKCGAIFEIASENGEANYCPNCGAKMESEDKK